MPLSLSLAEAYTAAQKYKAAAEQFEQLIALVESYAGKDNEEEKELEEKLVFRKEWKKKEQKKKKIKLIPDKEMVAVLQKYKQVLHKLKREGEEFNVEMKILDYEV